MSGGEARPVAPPSFRASDAEREAVASLLKQQALQGRLTLEEFSARLDGAYGAVTREELQLLTRDLPDEPDGRPVSRRRSVRWSLAVLGGVARRGRWRLPARSTAVAVMGGVDLDLRAAEIDGPEVLITAVAFMGGVHLTVPEGVDVELGGFAIMGGREERLADVPRIAGTPLIRVRAVALMGGVTVRSRPPRGRNE